MIRVVYEPQGVVASGPYSSAVDAGELVFFSGQTAMNTVNPGDVQGDIRKQTTLCFQSLFAVLNTAGLTPDDVVKVNVYLTDMQNFTAMNEVYQHYFSAPYPARTCVAVLALPLGAEVEIEMVARKPARG